MPSKDFTIVKFRRWRTVHRLQSARVSECMAQHKVVGDTNLSVYMNHIRAARIYTCVNTYMNTHCVCLLACAEIRLFPLLPKARLDNQSKLRYSLQMNCRQLAGMLGMHAIRIPQAVVHQPSGPSSSHAHPLARITVHTQTPMGRGSRQRHGAHSAQ